MKHKTKLNIIVLFWMVASFFIGAALAHADETLSAFTEQKDVVVGTDAEGKDITEKQTHEKYIVPSGNIIEVGTDDVSKKKIYKVLVPKTQAAELKKLITYQGNSELDLAMHNNALAQDTVKVEYLADGLDADKKPIKVRKRVTYREWVALGKPEKTGTFKPIVWQGMSDAGETLFFVDDMKEVTK